ncbi:MAG TPA: VanZ family protein [Pirellulales bacterium]|nr:VanZ family protein [Pirellulales bacterium]
MTNSNPKSKIVSPRTLSRRAKWCLGGYWLLLVLATHWPNPRAPGTSPRYPDKLVHFAAYGVLAFLAVPIMGRAASGGHRRFQAMAILIWVAVAALGLLDETTQPLTGRDFEWLDWLADCLGAACGLAAGRVWFRARPHAERGNE